MTRPYVGRMSGLVRNKCMGQCTPSGTRSGALVKKSQQPQNQQVGIGSSGSAGPACAVGKRRQQVPAQQ